jgi:hypothetical protein
MFEWLKKMLGMQKDTPPPGDDKFISIYDELNAKEKNAKNEKEDLTQSSIDWYSIEIQHIGNFPFEKMERFAYFKVAER